MLFITYGQDITVHGRTLINKNLQIVIKSHEEENSPTEESHNTTHTKKEH